MRLKDASVAPKITRRDEGALKGIFLKRLLMAEICEAL